jgi:hypothetical protein
MAKKSLPTADELRNHLDYNPETGLFIWKIPTNPKRVPKGSQAGTLNTSNHVLIQFNGTIIPAHRIAWCMTHGYWPEGDVDHANCIKSDNRLANLRACSRSQNMANMGRRKDNSSGFKGVSPHRDKWSAEVSFERKRFYLGLFDTPEAAHAAYCAKAQELHGEFARVN